MLSQSPELCGYVREVDANFRARFGVGYLPDGSRLAISPALDPHLVELRNFFEARLEPSVYVEGMAERAGLDGDADLDPLRVAVAEYAMEAAGIRPDGEGVPLGDGYRLSASRVGNISGFLLTDVHGHKVGFGRDIADAVAVMASSAES